MNLTKISQSLSANIDRLDWSSLNDAAFTELRNKFVVGKVSASDLFAPVRKTGLLTRTEFPNGRPSQFVGEAVRQAYWSVLNISPFLAEVEKRAQMAVERGF